MIFQAWYLVSITGPKMDLCEHYPLQREVQFICYMPNLTSSSSLTCVELHFDKNYFNDNFKNIQREVQFNCCMSNLMSSSSWTCVELHFDKNYFNDNFKNLQREVQFICYMSNLVSSSSWTCVESSATYITLIRSLSSMYSLMSSHHPVLGKDLPTKTAIGSSEMCSTGLFGGQIWKYMKFML